MNVFNQRQGLVVCDLLQVTPSGKLKARRHGVNFDQPANFSETYNPFGRPGGGAPRLNWDGQVAPAISKNPDLCFTKHLKNEVEIAMVRLHFGWDS